MSSTATGEDRQENPRAVAISPHGNAALVGNRLGEDVAIIAMDGEEVSRVGELPLAEPPTGDIRVDFPAL